MTAKTPNRAGAYYREGTPLTSRTVEEVAEAQGWSLDHICRGSRSDGERCRAPAMRGQSVCISHGGGAPSSRAAAQRRLATLVDPALDALYRILTSTKAKDADVLRAAENVFDRAGMPRRNELGVEAVRETLLERLEAMERAETGLQAAGKAPLALPEGSTPPSEPVISLHKATRDM